MNYFDRSDFRYRYIQSLIEGTCVSGKNRYPNSDAAAAALEFSRLCSDYQPWRQECRTYFCPLCRGIHLTKHRLDRAA